MTREETKEAIKVMQHYVDGGMVGHYRKDGCGNSYFVESKDPAWNWFHETYIARPKKMKVTEEEKLEMNGIWVKGKVVGIISFMSKAFLQSPMISNYYILNPDTMEWEDRVVR